MQPFNWDIISLLVVCSLKIWYKCSVFGRVIDITGKASWILQKILFDNATTCLRQKKNPIEFTLNDWIIASRNRSQFKYSRIQITGIQITECNFT